MVIYCGNQNIDNKRITTLHVTSVKNIRTTALEIVVPDPWLLYQQ